MKKFLLFLAFFANATFAGQDAYLGEIMIFGRSFAPKGWHDCDGAIMSIQQNAALFSILGTSYGGNGVNTFALPDLRPQENGQRVAFSAGAPRSMIAIDGIYPSKDQ